MIWTIELQSDGANVEKYDPRGDILLHCHRSVKDEVSGPEFYQR